ncbi:hypothetical protein QEN19_001151 [Hanseniaspora menglaensis]
MKKNGEENRWGVGKQQTSIIEIKQIKQLVLQDYSNRLLKNDSKRLRQLINNKFNVSVKNVIRSSLSKDRLFINFSSYQDCLYCYNNRYSLERDTFIKLPEKPLFTTENNNFSVTVNNSNINNKILLFNELREYLPEGITNVEHLGKSGKFILSFENVKFFKLCLKVFKDKETRLSNGSTITITEMKNTNKKTRAENKSSLQSLKIKSTGKKMSRVDKLKKNKHFNFKESDTRSIITFKILNNIKLLNQDKKIKYRFIKKNKPSHKPNLYVNSAEIGSKVKNSDKRIIPANLMLLKKHSHISKYKKKDSNWNVSL